MSGDRRICVLLESLFVNFIGKAPLKFRMWRWIRQKLNNCDLRFLKSACSFLNITVLRSRRSDAA